MDHLTPEERELAHQKHVQEAMTILNMMMGTLAHMMAITPQFEPPILDQLKACLECLDYPEAQGVRPILETSVKELLVQVWTEAFEDDILVKTYEFRDLIGYETTAALLKYDYIREESCFVVINPELLKVPTT